MTARIPSQRRIGGLPADPLAEARAIVGFATDRNGMIPEGTRAELLALAQTHAAIAQAAALERIAAALEPETRLAVADDPDGAGGPVDTAPAADILAAASERGAANAQRLANHAAGRHDEQPDLLCGMCRQARAAVRS